MHIGVLVEYCYGTLRVQGRALRACVCLRGGPSGDQWTRHVIAEREGAGRRRRCTQRLGKTMGSVHVCGAFGV
eukprot:15454452-Alexandrium_andersonii.AAC.1